MKITVHYSDGSTETYGSIRDAERGIQETVLGCNFATTVEDIQVGDGGPQLLCSWRVELLPDPRSQRKMVEQRQATIADCGDKHNRLDRCIHCGL